MHTLVLSSREDSRQWENVFSSRVGAISPQIRVFKLEWSSESIGSSLTKVMRNLPELREVEVNYVKDPQDLTSVVLASAELQSLERLSLGALWEVDVIPFRWTSAILFDT